EMTPTTVLNILNNTQENSEFESLIEELHSYKKEYYALWTIAQVQSCMTENSLLGTIFAINVELDKQRVCVTNQEHELKRLKTVINKDSHLKKTMSDKIKDLEQRLQEESKASKNELKLQKQRMTDLNTLNQGLERQMALCKKNNHNQALIVKEALEWKTQFKQTVQQLELEKNQLDGLLKAKECAIQTANAKCGNLKSQVKELELLITTMEKLVKVTRQEAENHTKVIENLQASKANAQSSHEITMRELKASRKRNEELQSTINEIQENLCLLNRRNQEYQELCEKYANLESTVEIIKVTSMETLKNEKKLETWKSKNERILTSSHAAVQVKNHKLHAKDQELQCRISELNTYKTALIDMEICAGRTLNSLRNHNQELLSLVAVQDAKIHQVETLKGQMKERALELESLQTEKANTEHSFVHKCQEVDNLHIEFRSSVQLIKEKTHAELEVHLSVYELILVMLTGKQDVCLLVEEKDRILKNLRDTDNEREKELGRLRKKQGKLETALHVARQELGKSQCPTCKDAKVKVQKRVGLPTVQLNFPLILPQKLIREEPELADSRKAFEVLELVEVPFLLICQVTAGYSFDQEPARELEASNIVNTGLVLDANIPQTIEEAHRSQDQIIQISQEKLFITEKSLKKMLKDCRYFKTNQDKTNMSNTEKAAKLMTELAQNPALTIQSKSLQEQCNSQMCAFRTTQQKFKDLQVTIQGHDRELVALLKINKNECSRELQTFEAKEAADRVMTTDLRKQIQTLETKHQSQGKSFQLVKVQLLHTNKNLKIMTADYYNMKMLVAEENTQLKNEQAHTSHLTIWLKDTAEQRLESLQKTLNAQCQELESLKGNMMTHTDILSQKNAQLLDAQEQLEETLQELENLRMNNQDLLRELESLKDEHIDVKNIAKGTGQLMNIQDQTNKERKYTMARVKVEALCSELNNLCIYQEQRASQTQEHHKLHWNNLEKVVQDNKSQEVWKTADEQNLVATLASNTLKNQVLQSKTQSQGKSLPCKEGDNGESRFFKNQRASIYSSHAANGWFYKLAVSRRKQKGTLRTEVDYTIPVPDHSRSQQYMYATYIV
ncbi:hypothetical protein EV359DRAFT_68031, partial [Lentinula novae-zelandiae]